MSQMHKHFVPSGSFYVGKKQDRILQAFLGTCVGVAIYDPVADVGGLIHLLLPEQSSSGSLYQPEKYAVTGLPLFIDALMQAGAKKMQLRASMAGGVLVGPVSQQDLNLDIGGRTVEKVTRILAAEQIPLLEAETGGVITCCMSLDMTTWRCTVEPIGLDKFDPRGRGELPSLRDIDAQIEKLMPIPQVALKALRILNEERYEVRDLAREIKKDQIISGKVLRYVNSVFFSLPTRIDSIDQALVFVGSNKLIAIVMSCGFDDLYNSTDKGYSLSKGGLFQHVLGTAVISEQIARLSAKLQPSLAYTGGLLHDIGKVALDQFFASAFPLFYRALEMGDAQVLEEEERLFGVGHTEIGKRLADRWGFPESLTEVIEYHHCPENSRRHPDLVHMVYLADLIMSRFHAGLEVERMHSRNLMERLKTIGLKLSDLPQIIDAIPAYVFWETPAGLNVL